MVFWRYRREVNPVLCRESYMDATVLQGFRDDGVYSDRICDLVAEIKNFAPPPGLGPAGGFLLQKSGA